VNGNILESDYVQARLHATACRRAVACRCKLRAITASGVT